MFTLKLDSINPPKLRLSIVAIAIIFLGLALACGSSGQEEVSNAPSNKPDSPPNSLNRGDPHQLIPPCRIRHRLNPSSSNRLPRNPPPRASHQLNRWARGPNRLNPASSPG